jgi:hypothetical protein
MLHLFPRSDSDRFKTIKASDYIDSMLNKILTGSDWVLSGRHGPKLRCLLGREAAHRLVQILGMVIDGRPCWLSVASGDRVLKSPVRCANHGELRRDSPNGIAMQQSEFDKITALGRAEFALEEFRKRAEQLRSKSALATTMEEIATLNVEAAELLHDQVKISLAVHTGNPAPHLRLVSGTE